MSFELLQLRHCEERKARRGNLDGIKNKEITTSRSLPPHKRGPCNDEVLKIASGNKNFIL
jgi:hypothetical protein